MQRWPGAPDAVRFDARTPFAERERQHRSLREGLDRLRAMLGPDRGSGDELGQQIRSVRDQLCAQFAFEERMGHMHYLLAVRPSLETQLTRLRAEHREILSTLDRAHQRLDRAPSADEVRATVLSLLERFARHELDERQLLRSALRQADSKAP